MGKIDSHHSPLQSTLSTLEGITTHNSSSFFTTSIYLTRCSLSHSFNCGKRDSILFTSNPFFTLAINTISFVVRLRALYSSNHSLCFIPSVCFKPFIFLLQQLIIPYPNHIACYCLTGKFILILQHITPVCQQTRITIPSPHQSTPFPPSNLHLCCDHHMPTTSP